MHTQSDDALNVTVIGTVFVDCKGFALQPYLPTGRNLGTICFTHGGVGRNVAENMARLALPVAFVATVDATGLGEEVIARLRRTGIDTRYCQAVDNGMGMWLAIMDRNGDLAGSISQMPSLDGLENLILMQGEEIVASSSHIVLELDLNEEIARSITRLARHRNKPVYGIPGNLNVVLRNRDILKGLDCFICNHIEAERLSGIPFGQLTRSEQMAQCGAIARQEGLQSLVITLGAEGAVYYDRVSDASGYQPVFPVELVDSSGAGDAFFSGTVMGLIHQQPLAEAVLYGTKAAGWTIGSKENTCPTLEDIWHQDESFRQLAKKLPHSLPGALAAGGLNG